MEIYQNPASLRVADFIGNPRVNFVEGTGQRQADGSLIVISQLGQTVFSRELFTGEMSQAPQFDCVIGIRPEKVRIYRDSGEGRIEGHIYSVQSAGSDTTVHVKVGTVNILVKEMGIRFYEMDQKVYLEIEPDKSNLFDKATGHLVKRAVLDE